jgi:hypothetical protein
VDTEPAATFTHVTAETGQ